MLVSGALRRAGPVARRLRSFTTTSTTTSLPEKAGEAASSAGEAVKGTISHARTQMRTVWETYSDALTHNPILTNAVTSGVLCAGGDALAQHFEYRLGIMSPEKEAYNWPRTARMALWGMAIGGPILAMWYRTLAAGAEAVSISYAPVVSGRFAWLAERASALPFVPSQPEATLISPMKILMGKVVVDTMVFQAPYLNLYFAVTGGLDGLSAPEIIEKTRASFHRVWALSFLVWTPVQAVNLYFVPLIFQAPVVAAVNVGWMTILSILNHYHDYGTPRAPNPASPPLPASAVHANAPPGEGEGAAPAEITAWSSATPSTRAGLPGDSRAAELEGWEHERSQLRRRIGQLIAENRSLKLQLGQMHATSYSSGGTIRGSPRSPEPPH